MTAWLDGSAEPIHSMRDNMVHNVPMLAGMWGSHLGRKNARGRRARAWAKMLRDPDAYEPRFKKVPDQGRYSVLWRVLDSGMDLTIRLGNSLQLDLHTVFATLPFVWSRLF